MANYQHMLKRKGQTEYEPSGYINIPLWREGYERRVTIGGDQLHVRVVERMDGQRVIYTVEIDPLNVVERMDGARATHAAEGELT
ncbi:MAG: hypothetical protein ACLQJR_14810 [Stellaceae bacterium]